MKAVAPLSSHLKGGAIKIGDSQVRSFFAPEVPKDFNLQNTCGKYRNKRKSGKIMADDIMAVERTNKFS